MAKKKFNKICTVCGERAIGFNFGAISCESCKAFFRRNASNLKKFKCYNENKCKIDQDTRKYCRKCRLEKCFAIGMRQEWILNEKEKEIRRLKIEENKNCRQKTIENINNNENELSLCSQTDSIFSDSNDWKESDISDEDIVSNLMQIEKYVSNEENSEMFEMTINENRISDWTYRKAVEMELSDLPIPRPFNSFADLTQTERNHFIELLNASLILYIPFSDNKKFVLSYEEFARFFLERFEYFIHGFIKVVKNLNAFNTICENDQIALVKYSSLEVIFMRTARTYNSEQEQWTFVLDENNSIIVRLDLLRNARKEVYKLFKSYLTKISNEWDNDFFIFDLLMAIILFDPNRPELIHREPIKLQHNLYIYLLQRYLQSKYKYECESKLKFLCILNVLEDIQRLNEIYRKRTSSQKAKTSSLKPLVREILDLNS